MKHCFECDQPAEYDHHVVPLTRGGTKTVPLCGDCHGKSHHRDKRMSTGALTREGLAKAKARGVKLGSHRPGHWIGHEESRQLGQQKGGRIASDRRVQIAIEYYSTLMPLILAGRSAGLSLAKVADVLNAGDRVTQAGKSFTAIAVHRILKRASRADVQTMSRQRFERMSADDSGGRRVDQLRETLGAGRDLGEVAPAGHVLGCAAHALQPDASHL